MNRKTNVTTVHTLRFDAAPLPVVLAMTLLLASALSAAEPSDKASPRNAADRFDCVVLPAAVVDVASPTAGRLAAVHKDRSDLVKQDEIIAALDSDIEVATARVAEARARMSSEIGLNKANAEFGNKRRERIGSLHQRKVASRQDLDDAERDAVIANWQLRQARDLQRLKQLEFERANVVVDKKQVLSPIEGVVVERYKSAGEFVDDEPILRIAQLNTLHVETIVPMSWFGRLSPGMKAQVFTQLEEDAARVARVSVVDRVGDPAAGTFGVRLVLDNDDLLLPAGIKCQLAFLDTATTDAPWADTESSATELDTPRVSMSVNK